ncbi:MAG: PTS system mannose/fructose/sorbose family transporter subunit IID [candidate division WOR-3 bacterium]|nr:MAG: PTS system mannose/fructose/sorbose family transporter subunit IID [candidate division WOR-3 bacterium]
MRLGFCRLVKVFFSSLFLQTSWSFFSMQSMGFLVTLMSGVRKDQHADIREAHKGFFNTHPYMASYIVGATLRAHDEGKTPVNDIQRFIAIAQTSFASAGDLLFWRTVRPALLLLATILAVKIGIWGSLVFLVCYNVMHLYHRIRGIQDGYARGPNVIYVIKSARFTVVRRVFETIGALMCGLLCALVSLQTHALLIIPIAALILILMIKRLSSVIITIAIMLIMIIMLLV